MIKTIVRRFVFGAMQTQASKRAQHVRPFIGRNRVGIVGFAGKAFKIALPAPVDAAWLHQRVQSLPRKLGKGGTNITAALRVSLDVLRKAPAGAAKVIWLFSDGCPNKEVGGIGGMVAQAKRDGVTIHTTGFGDPGAEEYNERQLRSIAAGTPAGKFLRIQTLRELSAALIDERWAPKSRHRATYTMYAVDVSPSMAYAMDGRTRIDVVREAIHHALHWEMKTVN
jgi:Mg-chelatase subunit ChlD